MDTVTATCDAHSQGHTHSSHSPWDLPEAMGALRTRRVRLGELLSGEPTASRRAFWIRASVAWSTLAVASSSASTCASCSRALRRNSLLICALSSIQTLEWHGN